MHLMDILNTKYSLWSINLLVTIEFSDIVIQYMFHARNTRLKVLLLKNEICPIFVYLKDFSRICVFWHGLVVQNMHWIFYVNYVSLTAFQIQYTNAYRRDLESGRVCMRLKMCTNRVSRRSGWKKCVQMHLKKFSDAFEHNSAPIRVQMRLGTSTKCASMRLWCDRV